MKKLIAYFSATGITAAAAKELARLTGADVFEIRPPEAYTAADLDWRDAHSRSTLEMTDPSARPAMAGEVPDLGRYDVICVGFPIWWYVAPRIINTFLEGCDLIGKTVIPFATSGGSGVEKIPESIEKSCPGSFLLEPKLLNDAEALSAFAEALKAY